MSMTFSQRHGINLAGFGVGLRRTHWDQRDRLVESVDWLEVISENFMAFGGEPRAVLHAVRERVPVIPHGVNLSVGGPEPLRKDYLASLARLARAIDAPYVSDHLCYGYVGDMYSHDLLPLPHTEEAVRHVAARVRQVCEAVERPFVIENVSTYAIMPGSQMPEWEFVNAVIEEADCGLLLDVNNVYVNAENHGFDPREYLHHIDMNRVVQIHLAGHRIEGDLRIDDHGHPVCDEVWSLYADTLLRAGRLVPTLLEWDHQVPPLDRLLEELDRARTVARAAMETAV